MVGLFFALSFGAVFGSSGALSQCLATASWGGRSDLQGIRSSYYVCVMARGFSGRVVYRVRLGLAGPVRSSNGVSICTALIYLQYWMEFDIKAIYIIRLFH